MSNLSAVACKKSRALGDAFGDLKVKTKVLLGFSIILLLLATVSVLSYRGFSVIAGQFGYYAGVVDVASDASGIERDLVKLRRDIDNYVGTRNADAAKDALRMEKELQARIEAGRTHATDEAQRKALGRIAATIGEIIANFEKVEKLEAERVKFASEVLDVSGPKLAADFEDLIRKATQSGESNTAILASSALYEVMKARLYANLMLERHEAASAEQAEAAFATVEKVVGQIEKTAVDPSLVVEVGDIKTLIGSAPTPQKPFGD